MSRATSIIGSLRSSRDQRDARNAFVRAFFNGSIDDLTDFAIASRLYSSTQSRLIIRWRMERTVHHLDLGGDRR